MKQQVARLSPHQNGKVFAILMAVCVLVFTVPMTLVAMALESGKASPPWQLLLVIPVIYLVFGYVMVAVSCAVYNFMFKYIGGLEFESRQSDG